MELFFEQSQQLRLLWLFWVGLATLGVDPWHLHLHGLRGPIGCRSQVDGRRQKAKEIEGSQKASASGASRSASDT